MQTHVEKDESSAAGAAAASIASLLRDKVTERGVASLALSGGGTPRLMYAALSQLELPWHDIHVVQVDERVAPEGDEARNSTHIFDGLIDHVEIPAENWHPMPVNAAEIVDAAKIYASDLANTCHGRIDVMHLGLGTDGHTASWPPGDTDIVETRADVGYVFEFQGFDRLTLTPHAVNAASTIVWLVTGGKKRAVLQRWSACDPALPSSHARRYHEDVLVTDEDAWVSDSV